MKLKFKRASAPVFLLFFFVCPFLASFRLFVSSMDLPSRPKTSEVQQTQDGRAVSPKLETAPSGRLDSSLSYKASSATTQALFGGRNSVDTPKDEPCHLDKELVAQIYKESTSEWIVDDTVMKSLNNDLQELIQCTHPHDKLILKLQETVTPPKTMRIVHELEFIGEPSNATGEGEFGVTLPTFICPLNGPVFSVKTSHFLASGLRIENCAKSSGIAAIVIESNSKATFNRTTFKDNKSGAIYISQDANVTIKGARFDGNEATYGGAIYIKDNSHVKVVNSTFEGNRAVEGHGGAIHMKDNSTLEVHGSMFSGNIAYGYGGGMYVGKNNLLTLNGSTVSYNSAQYGGGMLSHTNNSLTMIRSTYSNNHAQHHGGGVYAYMNNALATSGASVLDNDAHRNGGGAYAYFNNSLVISGSDFSKSSARQYGGGMYASRHNSLTLTECTFSSNSAHQDGGGIVIYKNNSLTVSESTFLDNIAYQDGGGIDAYESNSFIVGESTFSNNTSQRYGGAMYAYNGNKFVLNASKFSYNWARFGGAMRLEDKGSLTITSCIFSNNIASRNGGALNINSQCVVSMFESSLSSNHASYGGGFYAYMNNSLDISRSAFSNNIAQIDGGGLLSHTSNSLALARCVFSNNHARQNGGGVCAYINNSLAVDGSNFSNNSAQVDGGGMRAYKNNSLNISGSMFMNNIARQDGGGIVTDKSNSLTISESTLANNSAKYGGGLSMTTANLVKLNRPIFSNNNGRYGGGLYTYMHNSLTSHSSFFSKNIAIRYGGAIYTYKRNQLTILDTTLLKNKAEADGGAMFARLYNKCIVSNSVFSHNKATYNGGAMHLYFKNSATLLNSTFEDNTARDGSSLFMELGGIIEISKSNFLNSKTTQYGTIYVGVGSNVSLESSNFSTNKATFGGCLYGYRSSVRVLHSIFIENGSDKLGGCFHLKSSSAHFQNTTMSQNNASEDGGAIYATMASLLHMEDSFMISNQASKGGAVRLMLDSRLLCYNCTIANNTAIRGGGCYIEGKVEQDLLAQITASTVDANRASDYGGGVVVKVFGSMKANCSDANVPCGRVLLVNTGFVNNSASTYGGALVATKPKGILSSCYMVDAYNARDFMGIQVMRSEIRAGKLKAIDPLNLCASWHGNQALSSASKNAIGTFGHNMDIKIYSSDGYQMFGDVKSGFILTNVSSGKKLPKIVLATLDAFGNGPAPTLHEKDAIMLRSDGFLQQSIGFSFENGNCSIQGIVGFVQPGNYTIQIIPRSDDILEAANLTLVVRNCQVNEESTRDGTFCETCGEASYNFNSSGVAKCVSCPKEADCNGRYIVPIKGYWHKSPCHDKVKKCIVEEACNYRNRTHNLTLSSQDFTDCNFNDTTLHEYGEAQCNQGYKGSLCGSCEKSHGRTPDLECLKCQSIMYSIGRLLGIVLLLLIETSATIKGALVAASRRLTRQNAMPLSHKATSSISVEEGSSTQARETVGEGSVVHQVEAHGVETTFAKELLQKAIVDATQAQCIALETWKILLNFFQVTSTAGMMNVRWTQKIIKLFKLLSLLGAATVNGVSRPIDCILSSCSVTARAIWRYLFSLFIPMIAIGILSVHWGYRALIKHSAERLYFWKRFVLVMITVTYITYFDITQHAVRVFNCVVVYDNESRPSSLPTSYWVADTSLKCYESTHIALITFSLVILTVVSVGFPFACSRALLKNRNVVNISSSRSNEMLGPLCGPFKKRFVYWECVSMIKKALLSIIIVFTYSLGIQAQGLLISMVLVFFLTIHTLCFPFNEDFNILNYLESGSLMISCTTYTLIQFLNIETLSEIERSLVSAVAIILDGVFVILLFVIIVKNLIAYAKASLKSQHIIDIQNEIGWFKTIRTYSYAWWSGLIIGAMISNVLSFCQGSLHSRDNLLFP